ncbi:MAG: hypothetical protein LBU08_01525 [Tannerellaceae bacterium]|jgi:hypothetical protein|nr:hypothetical protein [Tannerellaceae bacterium]
MKVTVKAIIEGGEPSSVTGRPYYTIRMDAGEMQPGYWIMGDGYSIDEAIKDFLAGYQEMKAVFAQRDEYFQELNFEFEMPRKRTLHTQADAVHGFL